MVVKEKKDFKGKTVSLEGWKVKLQEDFPFMEQDPDDEYNTYRKWVFECSGGISCFGNAVRLLFPVMLMRASE